MTRHRGNFRKDPSAAAPSKRALDRKPQDSASDRPEADRRALAPGLYLTATPIGNAADITLRALNVLRQCDAIVAEDTRVTARLLAIHGVSRPLLTYNDHNAPAMRPKLLAKLAQGERLALVSDAGTPLVSDPGHKLVRSARDAGIAVYSVPGASAVLAALIGSGLPADRFLFAGFLPPKSAARRTTLQGLSNIEATLILFEAPQRLAESLADMAEVLGGREAAIARELTKLHEEIRVASLSDHAAFYAAHGAPKGEITLVIAPGSPAGEPDASRLDPLLRASLAFMPLNPAVQLVAEATGASRNAVYARALALKNQTESGGDENL